MPIYLHPSNLVVDKKAIASKYIGGIEAFREKYITQNEPFNQEDNQIFSISRWNPDEFDIDELVENGLFYDEKRNYSTDFTICTRYWEDSWHLDWIKQNKVFAGHIDCDENEKMEVERISNLTVDEIGELHDKGQNPLKTIKS
ncbi:MAG: hypothetical protein IPP77_12515 [Bacteroidetes bacterium]|nr:hypothetical protein [Bacteroidota bacterium]